MIIIYEFLIKVLELQAGDIEDKGFSDVALQWSSVHVNLNCYSNGAKQFTPCGSTTWQILKNKDFMSEWWWVVLIDPDFTHVMIPRCNIAANC